MSLVSERISGLSSSGIAYAVAAREGIFSTNCFNYHQQNPCPIVLICPTIAEADELADALNFFLGSQGERNNGKFKVCRFYNWEVLPFDTISPNPETSAERIFSLTQLLSGETAVVITTVAASMQKLIAPNLLHEAFLTLKVKQNLKRDQLIRDLDLRGYQRTSLVESVGQFAARGAVVDFFTPALSSPVRVELYGDVIQSLRLFDNATQRTLDEVTSVDLHSVKEFISFKARELVQRKISDIQKRAEELSLPVSSWRSMVEAVQAYDTYPGIEHLSPLFGLTQGTLWDYIPEHALVMACDEIQLNHAADDFEQLCLERTNVALREGVLFPLPAESYLSSSEVTTCIKQRCNYFFDPLALHGTLASNTSRAKIFPQEQLQAELKAEAHSAQPLKPLANYINRLTASDSSVMLVVSHASREKRLAQLLENYTIEVESLNADAGDAIKNMQQSSFATVNIISGSLRKGLYSPEDHIGIITEAEIFPDRAVRKVQQTNQSVRRLLGSMNQLQEGNYIVHVDHGVGYYRGLRSVTVGGQTSDFLELEYADEAKLLIPIENIAKIQKYVGAEGKKPSLNKLGSKSWDQSKQKIRASVAEIAGELINLYAERESQQGVSFGEINETDREFADSFPYIETEDQQKAIEEVLADMNQEKPMDRLVCGDVGYGKTEVALRAAYKAVTSGKQAAVLVPTTILADQHYATFRERLNDFGVKVACLSRFYSASENKETLAKLYAGKIDIIIGTHKLLQSDVLFNDLGLVIIDEEHRFGVKHKEKLKQYRKHVDVLTLTATPIPRTMHMSMIGIRDLSVIETAPHNRQVIRTYLAPYSDEMVREAILRELQRSGQVFYIHNRVQNIQAVTDELAALVPEAKIRFAHGQMKESELEDIMHRFIENQFDVLVSTTIVESGLDIPNANTMIIRRADNFGLAELYQLRGRVGRSSRRAYCYLLIPDVKQLSADAKKRLQVLQSLDDLGQGFRLALQDMEIRGAGNLLGKDQSGNVAEIGYELYSRILKEAVYELRKRSGQRMATEPFIEPEVNIGVAAHIPPFYIPDVAERLIIYQRLADLIDIEDGFKITSEIEDRFGNMPDEVERLIELMSFRAELKKARVVQCNLKDNSVTLTFHPSFQVDPIKAIDLARNERNFELRPGGKIRISLPEQALETPLQMAKFIKLYLTKLTVPLD